MQWRVPQIENILKFNNILDKKKNDKHFSVRKILFRTESN